MHSFSVATKADLPRNNSANDNQPKKQQRLEKRSSWRDFLIPMFVELSEQRTHSFRIGVLPTHSESDDQVEENRTPEETVTPNEKIGEKTTKSPRRRASVLSLSYDNAHEGDFFRFPTTIYEQDEPYGDMRSLYKAPTKAPISRRSSTSSLLHHYKERPTIRNRSNTLILEEIGE